MPQNALLAGLLSCAGCNQPMIPTYTAKPGRRYRYYVCRSARRNGWNACGTKSVAATLIEGSVVEQLRTTIGDDQTREQLRIGDADLEAFEHNRVGLIRAVVKDVSFDGKTGAVSLNLRAKEAVYEN
jgi:site-specific DNA recombinase